MPNSSMIALPDEIIMNKILIIRDKKIMIDRDIETDMIKNKKDIALIFEALKQLLNPPILKRRLIGFNRTENK